MILPTMEWIKGNTTKNRMYGNECMKLEIMVWIYGIAIKVLNGWMILQLRYYKIRIEWLEGIYEIKARNLNKENGL